MSLLACLLFAGQTQAADPIVSLDLPATRVDRVLAALGAQTGERLGTMGDVRRHFIFVKVDGLPASKVKELIARAVGGTWSDRGTIKVLSSRFETDGAFDMGTNQRVEAWFKKTQSPPPLTLAEVDKLFREYEEVRKEAERGSPNPNMGKVMELAKASPMNRALTRMALALGKDFFSKLKNGDRVVFSDKPTRLQRLLPPAGAQALDMFARESTVFGERFRGSEAGEGGMNAGFLFGGSSAMDEAGATIVRSHFVVVKQMGNIMLGLTRYDAAGEVKTAGISPLGFDLEDMMGMGAMFGAGTVNEADLPFASLKTPVEVPAAQMPLVADLSSMASMSGGIEKDLSPETVEALCAMDRKDLLEYFPSVALRQASTELKRNIVAFVSDFMVFMPWNEDSAAMMPGGGEAKKGKVTTGDVLNLMATTFHMGKPAFEMDENTLVIPPTNAPFFGELMVGRFDREAMASALRRARSEGVTLDVVAQFSVVTENPMFMAVANQFLGAVARETIPSGYEALGADGAVLKLYGSLSDSQRRAARQGGLRLPLMGLTGPIGDRVQKLVFSSDLAVIPRGGRRSAPAAPEAAALTEGPLDEPSGYLGSMPSLAEEPTYALAAPWAPQAFIEIKVISSNEVFGHMQAIGGQDPGFMPPRKVTPAEVAELDVARSLAPGQPHMFYGEFSIGLSERVTATLNFGPPGMMKGQFRHDRVGRTSRKVKLADLPPAFRAEYEKEFARIRRMSQEDKAAGGSDTGGGTAPPPPPR